MFLRSRGLPYCCASCCIAMNLYCALLISAMFQGPWISPIYPITPNNLFRVRHDACNSNETWVRCPRFCETSWDLMLCCHGVLAPHTMYITTSNTCQTAKKVSHCITCGGDDIKVDNGARLLELCDAVVIFILHMRLECMHAGPQAHIIATSKQVPPFLACLHDKPWQQLMGLCGVNTYVAVPKRGCRINVFQSGYTPGMLGLIKTISVRCPV